MDPTECLRLARAAVAEHHRSSDMDDDYRYLRHLADAFEDLDGWLSKGGFLPTPWLRAHL